MNVKAMRMPAFFLAHGGGALEIGTLFKYSADSDITVTYSHNHSVIS